MHTPKSKSPTAAARSGSPVTVRGRSVSPVQRRAVRRRRAAEAAKSELEEVETRFKEQADIEALGMTEQVLDTPAPSPPCASDRR